MRWILAIVGVRRESHAQEVHAELVRAGERLKATRAQFKLEVKRHLVKYDLQKTPEPSHKA